MSNRKVVFIDGHAVVYRCFFGIPELCTADGRPTNAVLGFVRLLRQVSRTPGLTHWMVMFDGGLSEERVAALPSYKAQRPGMPDALRSQLPYIEEYLALSGIPWLRLAGTEADDLVATATRMAMEEGADILILSGDKDFYQLVGDRVSIMPPTDVAATFGASDVLAKTGVAPGQIVEWLSLVGDTSDNIDGVPGVGAKTAAKLLAAHQSLEGVWAALDSVKPDRLRLALAAAKETVMRNKALIALKSKLPIEPLDWSAMEVRSEKPEKLLPFYDRLELHSLARTV